MSSISLDNAWLLIIAIPVIVLIAVSFVIAVRKDNRNGHNIASCALHILMAAVIAFAAAGVTVETTLTETDVFVVADISYSANRNLDTVDGYINDIQANLPDNSQMGVVCFAKEATLLTEMGGTFTSVKDAGFTEEQMSQTNISAALEYAGERFKSGVIKRIVLITDAKQTGSGDDDELKQVVDRLTSENVHIDAIYLDNNITDGVTEVQLSGVSASSTVYAGRSSSVTATVESSVAQTATVYLYSEGEEEQLVSSRAVTLNSGTNDVSFDLPSDRDSGAYTYKVSVEMSGDANPYNNSYSFTQEVVGEVKVLFITGVSGDRTQARQIFGDMSYIDVDYYYNNTAVPYTVSEVCDYDVIVLSNIDVSTLDNYSMFIDSLEVAVSQLGKSLIAIGDLNLQNNTDDEALAKLENMLPVTYGNAVRDQKVYVLVIDCSYSMTTSSKLAFARESAEAVLDLLNSDDIVYIVKFYSEVSPETYYGQVGDGSEAKAFIEDITLDNTYQGTVISGGFNYVLNNIAGISYSAGYATSVLLITDGLSSDEQEVYTAVQSLYNNYGITTSVIDVGNANSDNASTKTFLDAVATYGGGSHFYYTYNLSLDDILPTIANEVGETIVEGVAKTVSVSYKNYNDDVLEGLKDGGYLGDNSYSLSYIEGFVLSSAKSSATTVLTASYTSGSSSVAKSVPIYSYWNYGNGGSAAFTSSISGSWVSQWSTKGILKTFFTDVFATSTPSERVDTPYTMTANKDGDTYSLEITPVEIKSDAELKVYVNSAESYSAAVEAIANGEADGMTGEITVVFDSTSYISSFSVDEVGEYVITVEYTYKGTSVSYDYYVDVSYLAEYDSFTLYEASLLYKIIGSDGTVSESGAFKIENDEDEISKSTASLTIPLLVTAVVLYAVDITIRKLKWNDIVSLFRKVNKERKS